MVSKSRAIRALAVLIALLLPVAPAAAQNSEPHSQSSTTGEDNEFGSIRTPYQMEVSGEPVIVEATVVLHEHYQDQKATFFMFAWDTQSAPAVDAEYIALETKTGEALKVTEVQSEPELVKWFVDVEDLPGVGATIVMRAEVDVRSKGFFSVAAMVVPFNYRWEQVQMSDGAQAKLYGFTQLGVNQETTSEAEAPRFGDAGGGKLPVPNVGAAVAVAAIGGVALAAGRRRRG